MSRVGKSPRVLGSLGKRAKSGLKGRHGSVGKELLDRGKGFIRNIEGESCGINNGAISG